MRSQLTEDIASFLLENTDHKKAHIDQASFEVQLRKLICQQLAGITLPDVAAYFTSAFPMPATDPPDHRKQFYSPGFRRTDA